MVRVRAAASALPLPGVGRFTRRWAQPSVAVQSDQKPQNLSFRGQVYRPRNLFFLNCGTANSRENKRRYEQTVRHPFLLSGRGWLVSGQRLSALPLPGESIHAPLAATVYSGAV
jgi:hypothetical protein